MSFHIRRQIREAAATLVTGLATSGTNVFQSRIRNLAAADLPALRVYTTPEDIEDSPRQTGESDAYLQHRNIEIRVEAVARVAANLDDTLDQMCKEVEVAIAADSTLGGLAKLHCALRRTEIDLDGNTDVPAGKATMTFEVSALTMSNAPDVPVTN